MVVREFLEIREDGVNLYRTYSDKGYRLRQVETGIIYDDPVDVGNAPYTYEETNVLIGLDEEITEPDKDISAEELLRLFEEAL